ncbi:hypothetical protein AAF712_014618 [Marasmius tenuissimus]|uniref:Uncharacterized protein n=1 Tax=Marasmius tenuissimus TaxID=585030 RepID=A0ABR2ZE54_9AGAR
MLSEMKTAAMTLTVCFSTSGQASPARFRALQAFLHQIINMPKLPREYEEGSSRLALYCRDDEDWEDENEAAVKHERELAEERKRDFQSDVINKIRASDHFQRINWDAARVIADVVTASLLAGGACSSPQTHESTPEPTPEPATNTTTPVEEVMGPDLGPEETGTRPMYTGRRDPWVGTAVLVIGSQRKGLTGTLQSVNIDWSLLDTVIDMSPEADYSNIKSGLLLDIELDVVLAGRAAPIKRIDYRDVVELRTLAFECLEADGSYPPSLVSSP